MIRFFKTLGKWALYVLAVPVILSVIGIYAIVGVGIFLFMGGKALVLFFTGRNIFAELPEDIEAKRILELRKEAMLQPPYQQPVVNPYNNYQAPNPNPYFNQNQVQDNNSFPNNFNNQNNQQTFSNNDTLQPSQPTLDEQNNLSNNIPQINPFDDETNQNKTEETPVTTDTFVPMFKQDDAEASNEENKEEDL